MLITIIGNKLMVLGISAYMQKYPTWESSRFVDKRSTQMKYVPKARKPAHTTQGN